MMASPVRVSSQLIIAAVFQDEDNGKIQLLPKDVTNEYIIKACSCFLLYDQRTDAFDFSHRSAWKYLKTQFSAETCNLYLARLSLKILSKTQKCDKAIAQKPPFDCIRPIVIHSAGFWFLYVRSLGNKAADDSQLQDLLREFLQPRGTQSGMDGGIKSAISSVLRLCRNWTCTIVTHSPMFSAPRLLRGS